MDIYADDGPQMVLPATEISAERTDTGVLLHVCAPNNMKLTFLISEEMLKSLK
jgi:hypothetical protein